MGEQEGMQEHKINDTLKCNVAGRRILLWRTTASNQAKSFVLTMEEISMMVRVVDIEVERAEQQAVEVANPYKDQLDVLQESYDTLKQQFDSASTQLLELQNVASEREDVVKRLQDRLAEFEDKGVKFTEKRSRDETVLAADSFVGEKEKKKSSKKTNALKPEKHTWTDLNLEYLTLKNITYKRIDWDATKDTKYIAELNAMTEKYLKANSAFESADAFAELSELDVIQDEYGWSMFNRAVQTIRQHMKCKNAEQREEYIGRLEMVIEAYLENNGALDISPIYGQV